MSKRARRELFSFSKFPNTVYANETIILNKFEREKKKDEIMILGQPRDLCLPRAWDGDGCLYRLRNLVVARKRVLGCPEWAGNQNNGKQPENILFPKRTLKLDVVFGCYASSCPSHGNETEPHKIVHRVLKREWLKREDDGEREVWRQHLFWRYRFIGRDRANPQCKRLSASYRALAHLEPSSIASWEEKTARSPGKCQDGATAGHQCPRPRQWTMDDDTAAIANFVDKDAVGGERIDQ
ncbi:hypothetical protein GQ43DRAFT_498963 [Delitschia confertaspora ATCC 74209]|uniref:Uncharacterized protein n=1 Tax=Delitschia confertaspora ATCC 74209 TaxID=1513339 RepID=A0A9P4MRW1_9PLEO|nr:hypothetical protein GQ43DRAFT_498963 [Delitschia confertaspora ATCC 74209]